MPINPQIEFRHVLNELSVNRHDPCEVLRELISNSYDAKAEKILYVPLKDQRGFAFFDDGTGLDTAKQIHGITPWAAFFSIGKSTKKQGDGIGYKCQGSKLCFACGRILVATIPKITAGAQKWSFKIIENPRSTLDVKFDITPDTTTDFPSVLDQFFTLPSADTTSALNYIKSQLKNLKKSATLIVIDHLDTESFDKYFAVGDKPETSYVENYIRYYTRHGDVRHITTQQGFSGAHRKQVGAGVESATLNIFATKKVRAVPFGYPYLSFTNPDPSIRTPAQVSRLRDGRFCSRAAKSFSVGAEKYSIILAIDGNRRAHDEYRTLDRKGKTYSGIKLSDHRGVFVSVKGIKVCKYPDLLVNMDGYEVLAEGDSASHYTLILEGDLPLVTNRGALTKSAFDRLTHQDFVAEVKKFLDSTRASDPIFRELLARLRRESSETLLNEQIELLECAKEQVKARERFRVNDGSQSSRIFLSPSPGEEYLVGVLYSQLGAIATKNPGFEKYWRRIITFSTQGVDSLGLIDEAASPPLASGNLCAVEYKYEFNNTGPFNHALAVVDYIVAWEINLDLALQVRDTYTCFGTVSKVDANAFEWRISNLENDEGAQYLQTITVLNLRELIKATFSVAFIQP